jgi:hypothetical protein
VPYTVNSDGTYTLSDPTGNLLAAYEVPNYALLIQAAKTGPNHNESADHRDSEQPDNAVDDGKPQLQLHAISHRGGRVRGGQRQGGRAGEYCDFELLAVRSAEPAVLAV